jgi:hypothetical protein
MFFPQAPPVFVTLDPSTTGISFLHDNAQSPRRYLPETMGAGVAVLDFDGDGLMDIYFPNSGPSDFFQPARPLQGALYRNLGGDRFEDVTGKAGVPGGGFHLGAYTCDYNKDGLPDLFLTTYGRNILYRNNGDGTFTDATAQAGLDAPGLYTAAVWFDLDNDGDQDLYAAHFVRYEKSLERDCSQKGVHHYCYPLIYEPHPSRLYRNNGDGTFSDISASSGIGDHPGKAFGAVATDVNNDGLLDLFVANDTVSNFLFLNKGRGRFEEISLEAGVAYSADGAARSGMGVDAADFDDDGFQDLFVANVNRERFSLYRNNGDLTFSDRAGPTGIGAATVMYSGWGVRFFDFDHDGDLDLILANSHPDDLIEEVSSTLTYKEPLLLLENRNGKFTNMGPRAGDAFTHLYPARGIALADLNNDGHSDVIVANIGQAPLLLQHTANGTGHWVGLDLGMTAQGAIIRWSAGGKTRSLQVPAGGSYLSSSDPRQLIGLGPARGLDWIEISLAGRKTRRFENVAADRYYRLTASGELE